MVTLKFTLVFTLLAFIAVSAVAQIAVDDKRAQPVHTINSEEELKQVLSRLELPLTRMETISQLCQFAAMKIYNHGGSVFIVTTDPRINALQDLAASAVLKYTVFQTVSDALDSPDRTLQYFGVRFYRTDFDRKTGGEEASRWNSLRPKLERLAIDGDETVRAEAVRKLVRYPDEEDFLQSLIPQETSPYVIQPLLNIPGRKENEQRFTGAMLRLLSDTDPKVRIKALTYIGGNVIAAPVCHIDFDPSVYDRVLELCGAESDEERAAAAFALTDIKGMDVDRSLRTFIRLAEDRSIDVRWRVGFGLVGHLEREDVKAAIARLLSDSSSEVRYMTMVALGPEKFTAELTRLVDDADPRVAGWAAGTLKRIEQDKRRR